MGKWRHRSSIYKVTVCLIFFVFLIYALAFAVPTWNGTKLPTDTYVFLGLWLTCAGSDTADFDNCNEQAFGDDNLDWMDAVRGVWVAGMFFYLLAVLYNIVENCCSDEDGKDYGFTGALVLLAGLCGAAGVIVVAVKNEDLDISLDYYWGYILACIASGLAMILAIVLLITRNTKSREKSRANRTADYVFAHKPATPYAPEYPNHAYAHDIPLSNGVGYHHVAANQPQPYTLYQGQSGYPSNSLPHPRNQGSMYASQPGYNPYTYDMGRTNQRHSMAESADLSNGYTTELIHAEHSLSRSQVGQRGDYGRGGDYFLNGNRPY